MMWHARYFGINMTLGAGWGAFVEKAVGIMHYLITCA